MADSSCFVTGGQQLSTRRQSSDSTARQSLLCPLFLGHLFLGHLFLLAPNDVEWPLSSIVKRKNEDNKAPFWGFRLHEVRPEIGDIVCKWRETPRDFEDAEASDSFKSHSDIVVSVQPDFVLAIGGNVGNSVNITRYKKTGAGFLAPQDAVFIHMVNRT